MQPIDLTGWKEDEEFSPYPEGARDKYALIAPGESADTRIIPGHRYLMKFSNPRYPAQFWCEIIARIVGEHTNVPVPLCFYAHDLESGMPGSLIEWFYGEKVESEPLGDVAHIFGDVEDSEAPTEAPSQYSLYVPGSNYMIRRTENYDLKTGRQHNLRHIGALIAVFRQRWGIDYWPHWARVLTFDALIGNTDRHQDNWGVLWRASAGAKAVPRFAPAFDNGTALLHEIIEDRLARFDDPDFLHRYVMRGRHHVRWEVEDAKPVPHLELVRSLVKQRPKVAQTVSEVLEFDSDALSEQIMALTALDAAVQLTQPRAWAICQVIKYRRDRLLQMIAEI